MRGAAWCAAALALAPVGCARQAPTPQECQRFAVVALGLRGPEQLEVPAVRKRFDAQVFACLTEPYDQATLRCAAATGDARGCVALLERRRAAERRGPLPPGPR